MLHVFAVVAVLFAGPPAAAAAARVSGIGTVLQLGPATRAWLIRTDDGASYEALNLAPAFRRDGLRVRFRARLVPRHRPLTAGARTIRIVHIAALVDGATSISPPPRPSPSPR